MGTVKVGRYVGILNSQAAAGSPVIGGDGVTEHRSIQGIVDNLMRSTDVAPPPTDGPQLSACIDATMRQAATAWEIGRRIELALVRLRGEVPATESPARPPPSSSGHLRLLLEANDCLRREHAGIFVMLKELDALV